MRHLRISDCPSPTVYPVLVSVTVGRVALPRARGEGVSVVKSLMDTDFREAGCRLVEVRNVKFSAPFGHSNLILSVIKSDSVFLGVHDHVFTGISRHAD